MKKVPDYREIECNVSAANIKDQIAALLYASGLIHDNEDVIDLVFNKTSTLSRSDRAVTIKVKVKRQQQVEIIQH